MSALLCAWKPKNKIWHIVSECIYGAAILAFPIIIVSFFVLVIRENSNVDLFSVVCWVAYLLYGVFIYLVISNNKAEKAIEDYLLLGALYISEYINDKSRFDRRKRILIVEIIHFMFLFMALLFGIGSLLKTLKLLSWDNFMIAFIISLFLAYKYELSKLLGKHLRIGGLIKDVRETGFERHISKIFNSRVIIENYTVWEKIVEVLVINESWEPLKVVIKNIVEAINSLDYQNADMLVIVKNTMKLYLYATLSRCLALVWGTEIKEIIKAVCRECINYVNDRETCICYLSEEHRKSYCETRMIDKSVMPIFQDMLDMDTIYTTEETLNLCCFQQTLKYSKYDWGENTYVYYPYLVTMYDFSMISCIEQLNATQNQFDDMKSIYKSQIDNYVKSNYAISDNARIIRQIIYVEKFKDKDAYLVQINNSKKNRLKLAIANVRLDHDNFKKVVIDDPNRSYQRYKDLSKIINAAIDENADMLIMPEAYVPFEWLATVARTCARNNLAVVTGIEHIKQGNQVFNLTAVILPYEDLENKSALISFHLKKHYAPIEKQEINGYRLKEVTGKHYELYQWHDCYFPVYCCYELTSIVERAMFQSYADFLVAIEWNRDVNYYSNILESLSRDIHCYCVQVNSSNYGDSRITMPSKTEEKDIMRTKGGKNSTILVDEIDIKKIREFQLKDYNLQMKDKGFKTTPPGFDHKIVLDKIRGEKLK